MSLGGRSEQRGFAERIGLLRDAIARIEAGAAEGESAEARRGVSLARRRSAFFEIAPAQASDHPAAAGFALAVAGRFRAGGPVLWIAEDFALLEWGAPYGPGLAAYGVALGDFTLMRLARRADVWLATEEAIRAGAFGAVVAEPSTLGGAETPALVRRLAMAARAAGARTILLRPPASQRLPFLAPSPMRFEVASRPAPRPAAGRKPLPGAQAWRVRHTGPPGSLPQFASDAVHDIAYPGEDFFRAALSLPPSRQPVVRAA